MAAFLQPADPWIEDTFFHAITFDSSINPLDSSNNNPESESSPDKSQRHDDESQWDQTENTIPPGLLPSQQPLHDLPANQVEPPSRQSKIVQIIHRGGSGWDGSHVNTTSINDLHYCPPYVILHDGQFSTVAFLSQEAQRSIGMNVVTINNNNIDTKSSGYESDNSAASRRSLRVMMQRSRKISLKEQQQKITLKDKCLASINQYTVSTIRQCCCCPSSTTHKKHSDVITSMVLNSLDIPISMHHQLAPLQHVFMCLYVTGTITVIGAENQGLIGESKDVHTSQKVRQVLRDCLRQDSNDTVATTARKEHQYEYFMRQLETVHLYYQNKANDYAMDNDTVSDWPWESRLSI